MDMLKTKQEENRAKATANAAEDNLSLVADFKVAAAESKTGSTVNLSDIFKA